MFEVEVSVDKFKKILSALSLFDEATFRADDGGISIQEIDAPKAAMVDMKINDSYFEKYKCDEEKFRVDLENLRKIMKRIKTGIIGLKPEENKLKITHRGFVERTFITSLLSFDETEPKQPKTTFLSRIVMLADAFKNAIEDAKIASDIVEFATTKNTFLIVAESNYNKSITKIEDNDECVVDFDVKEPCRAIYPLNYLSDFIKTDAEMVEIAFSTDMPLKLVYQLDKEDREAAKAVYFLAPRRGY